MKNIKENSIYIAIRKCYWKVKRIIRSRCSSFYRFYTLKVCYPNIYKKGIKKNINPQKVVFVEVRLPRISNSFTLFYKKISEKYNFDIHTHFLGIGLTDKYKSHRCCKKMVKDICDAKYIILNEGTNVIGTLPIREETTILQLWHGCGAFKKFGRSTADLIFGDDKKNQEKYPAHENYTYVTVSSPEVVWAYEEAMPCGDTKGVVRPVGVSRTDIFFDDVEKEKAFQRFYSKVPSAKGKKVILYAPTFRGRVANAKTSFELNAEMMYENFGDEYVLVYNHHPLVKERPIISDNLRQFAFDVTGTVSIDDLIIVSDICISDYSSLVFEYSLFERPMVFFAYDLDEYYDWRGFYYDYKEFVPGPIFTTTSEIVYYINNIEKEFDKDKVRAFKEKFMSSCDGHSTERIMEMTFGEDLKLYRR